MLKSKTLTSQLISIDVVSKPVSTPRHTSNLSFMHRPPTIMPNYGPLYKGGHKLKTNLPKVLLYDNVTQQSMLDAHISGLQSQRYKTGRKMETSLKAFLNQTQDKEKALKKLTKVHHADDYAQFELEHSLLVSKKCSKMVNSNYMNSLELPEIQREKELRMISPNLPRRIRKRRQYPLYISAKETNYIPGRVLSEFSTCENSTDNINLPVISNAFSVSLVTNNRIQDSSVQKIVLLPRSQSSCFDESTSGDIDISQGGSHELTVRDSVERETNRNKHHEINEVYLSNMPIENNVSNLQASSGKNTGEVITINTFAEVTSASKYYTENGQSLEQKKKPILDQRFEHLQKVLVRQDPPNEGFSELSPSFAKTNIFQYFSEKPVHFSMEDSQFSS